MLTFWLKLPIAGDVTDSITVAVDGIVVWSKTGQDTVGYDTAYKQVVINSPLVPAGIHVLAVYREKGCQLLCSQRIDR